MKEMIKMLLGNLAFSTIIGGSLLVLDGYPSLANAEGCPHSKLPRGSRNEPAPHRVLRSGKYGEIGKDNKVHLTQEDFEEGTYRITTSGKYVLDEDIEFGPQVSNDYWPPMDLWDVYPPSAYYLGFFAAITIEADVSSFFSHLTCVVF